MSYAQKEMQVLHWGEKLGIVQHGKPMGQAFKTLEEASELLEAIYKNDREATIDAVGDVVVTLIMVCATLDLDLTECLGAAYEQIKDRKGYLRPDGVFEKQ